MIRYINAGERYYSKKPVPCYKRRYWEFQAILSGSAVPIPVQGKMLPSPNIYLFSPDDNHGWSAADSGPSEITVFHFDTIPELLKIITYDAGRLCFALTPPEVKQLRELYTLSKPYLVKTSPLLPLIADKIVNELALILLKKVPAAKLEKKESTDIVTVAMDWFRANPDASIRQVAAALDYSESHLRRLFINKLGESPKEVLTRERMTQALELLTAADISITEIALTCGYTELSSFSRTFTRITGMSPREYRKKYGL
jgi:AraC-like DNA-binding protein